MIVACWDEKRDKRWDIHSVYSLLSVSSTEGQQEGARRQNLLRLTRGAFEVLKKFLCMRSSLNLDGEVILISFLAFVPFASYGIFILGLFGASYRQRICD